MVANKRQIAKTSASQIRRWNRIQQQYAAEMEQLLKQLFPEAELPPMVYWDHSSLWDDLEMFGIVLLEDNGLESLKGFWVDQDTGRRNADYYIPSGYIDIDTISVDNPPTVDAAWDARPA